MSEVGPVDYFKDTLPGAGSEIRLMKAAAAHQVPAIHYPPLDTTLQISSSAAVTRRMLDGDTCGRRKPELSNLVMCIRSSRFEGAVFLLSRLFNILRNELPSPERALGCKCTSTDLQGSLGELDNWCATNRMTR
jgi:hypothetical protein